MIFLPFVCTTFFLWATKLSDRAELRGIFWQIGADQRNQAAAKRKKKKSCASCAGTQVKLQEESPSPSSAKMRQRGNKRTRRYIKQDFPTGCAGDK
jgi:hypothetical protein